MLASEWSLQASSTVSLRWVESSLSIPHEFGDLYERSERGNDVVPSCRKRLFGRAPLVENAAYHGTDASVLVLIVDGAQYKADQPFDTVVYYGAHQVLHCLVADCVH